MNLEYLNSLPEVENLHNFNLEEGEKAIFVTNIQMFGNQKGLRMHDGRIAPPFTLTNKKMYIRGDISSNVVWIFDLQEDIKEIKWTEGRFLKIFKTRYYNVALKHEIKYTGPSDYPDSLGRYKMVEHTLTDIELFLMDQDKQKFDEIIKNLYN